MGDIKHAFPLPGTYLFRFKTRYNKSAVFMDVFRDGDRLPHFDQKVVMKVTRLSFGGAERPSSSDAVHASEDHSPTRTGPSDAHTPDFSLL